MPKNKYQHITDAELLLKYYTHHNNEWIGILLERYSLLVFGVCMKYVKDETKAKENVQQIFLKVLQALPHSQVTYFKSWLYMVTKNHCLMEFRKNKHITQEIADNTIIYDTYPKPLEDIDKNDIAINLIEPGLKELNVDQQQCITLFYIDKKSYKEISQALGFSILQVKSYIQNGKRNLKIWIEKKMKENSNE